MSLETVSAEEWRAARATLLKREKEATWLLQSIAIDRRNLPVLEIEDPVRFKFLDIQGRRVDLLDLFGGRKQLIVYHHMSFSPDGEGCGGCSFFSDHIPHGPVLHHLHSRDTTFAATAPEDPVDIKSFKERMGWSFPFYSSRNTWSNIGSDEQFTWEPDKGSFRLNCFVRQGDKVYLTWTTTSRGVEPALTTYALLDMTKMGRQEGNGAQFKLHDQY